MNANDQAMLKAGIAFLKKQCLKKADANLYIDLILDNADEPPYDQLVHMAATQDFSAFVSVDAELAEPAYNAFFRQIYDGLRSAANEQNQLEANPAGPGGDSGNTSGNGPTGKAG